MKRELEGGDRVAVEAIEGAVDADDSTGGGPVTQTGVQRDGEDAVADPEAAGQLAQRVGEPQHAEQVRVGVRLSLPRGVEGPCGAGAGDDVPLALRRLSARPSGFYFPPASFRGEGVAVGMEMRVTVGGRQRRTR